MKMKPSTRLLKLLKTPAQVANALDWKKGATSAICSTTTTTTTVATLHIGQDRIGMAIASHPDLGRKVHTIQPPIELNLVTKQQQPQRPYQNDDGNCSNEEEEEERNHPQQGLRVLSQSTIEELRYLCDYYDVGSFLVWWPLQPEGRPGARCGKVLHTLESLIEQDDDESTTTNDRILSNRRPIALWTGNQNSIDDYRKYAEDEWGRSSVYSRVCVYNKRIHRASTEQYCHPRGSSACAVETWDEFCKQYWPDAVVNIDSQQHQQQHQQYQHQDSNHDFEKKELPLFESSVTKSRHTTNNNKNNWQDDDDNFNNNQVSSGGDITRSRSRRAMPTRRSTKRMAA